MLEMRHTKARSSVGLARRTSRSHLLCLSRSFTLSPVWLCYAPRCRLGCLALIVRCLMPRSAFQIANVLLPCLLLHAHGLNAQGKEVTVAIFGDRKVSVTMKDGMPISAEDKNIKIQVAGLGSSPDKSDPTKRTLFWMFGFTQKQGPKIIEIKLEELSSDKPDRLVTTDAVPNLKKDYWSFTAEPVVISESTTPWLYESRNSAFLFRFTIRFEGGSQSVLDQMSIFPGQAKTYLIQPIKAK